jgi:hypothetical protein
MGWDKEKVLNFKENDGQNRAIGELRAAFLRLILQNLDLKDGSGTSTLPFWIYRTYYTPVP